MNQMHLIYYTHTVYYIKYRKKKKKKKEEKILSRECFIYYSYFKEFQFIPTTITYFDNTFKKFRKQIHGFYSVAINNLILAIAAPG